MLRRQQATQSQRAFRDGLPPLTQPRPFGSRPSVHSTTKWLKRSNNRLGGGKIVVQTLTRLDAACLSGAVAVCVLFLPDSRMDRSWFNTCVCVHSGSPYQSDYFMEIFVRLPDTQSKSQSHCTGNGGQLVCQRVLNQSKEPASATIAVITLSAL